MKSFLALSFILLSFCNITAMSDVTIMQRLLYKDDVPLYLEANQDEIEVMKPVFYVHTDQESSEQFLEKLFLNLRVVAEYPKLYRIRNEVALRMVAAQLQRNSSIANAQTDSGTPLFILAVRTGIIEMVQPFIDAGVNINCTQRQALSLRISTHYGEIAQNVETEINLSDEISALEPLSRFKYKYDKYAD